MSQTPPVPSYPFPLGYTIGQTLDRVFKLFRAHFSLWLRLSLGPAGAMLILYALLFGYLFLSGFFPKPGNAPDLQKTLWVTFPAFAVIGMAFMCVFVLLEAAACHAAMQSDAGVLVSARDTFRVAAGRLGRLVWLSILRALLFMAPAAVFFVFIAGLTGLGAYLGGHSHPGLALLPWSFLVLLYFGWMVCAVLIMLRLALAVPACLAEDRTAAQSLKRSFQLTRKANGRIFVVLLVIYAVTYAAILIAEIVAMVVAGMGMLLAVVFHLPSPGIVGYVGLGAVGVGGAGLLMVFMALSWILYALAFGVIYRDQRRRMEGAPPRMPAGDPA